MAVVASLDILLKADTRKFSSGFNAAERRMKSFEKTISSFKTTLLTAFAGFGAASIFRNIVDAAGEAERQERKLESVLTATGNAAGFTSTELSQYASQLQRVTVFEDDATKGALAVLASFKQIRGPIFKDAIVAAMDLSTVMGQDLQSSVLLVGKALNDPVRGLTALQRSGVQFNDVQRKQIASFVAMNRVADAQRIILEELRSQFGGAAQADAQTMAGAIAQLKNAWGDLGETIGNRVAPTVKALAIDLKTLLTPPQVGRLDAAANLNEVTKLEQRRNELLRRRSDLLSRVQANAEQAQQFSILGAGAAIATIEIDSMAADLRTINRELLMVERKMRDNRKFLEANRSQGGIVNEAFRGATTTIENVSNGVVSMFDRGIQKAKELNALMKEGPAIIKQQLEAIQKEQEAKMDIIEGRQMQVEQLSTSIQQSIATPLERFKQRMAEVQLAFQGGGLTRQQAAAARIQALDELRSSLPDRNRRAGAIEFGSRESFSARLGNESLRTEKEILEAARQQVDLLGRAVTAFETSGEVVVSF